MGQEDALVNSITDFIKSCLRMGYPEIHASDISGFLKDNNMDMDLSTAASVLRDLGCQIEFDKVAKTNMIVLNRDLAEVGQQFRDPKFIQPI